MLSTVGSCGHSSRWRRREAILSLSNQSLCSSSSISSGQALNIRSLIALSSVSNASRLCALLSASITSRNASRSAVRALSEIALIL